MNFQLQDHGPLHSHNPSTEEQDEEGLLPDPTEKRFVPCLSSPTATEDAGYDFPAAQEHTSRSLSPVSTTEARLKGENADEP